ncbi:AAA family ATPase [Nonomuraea sp. NPDC049421]|uniref:helix-turn-helix transcriptional regulator n=1 Tax=Nonomuraea sp. NPDC049421 TaxID=3155275 RepID=UPI00341A596C
MGRENEIAEVLRRLESGRVLVLAGDPGAGKSALLDVAAGHAGRVLRAAGSESEACLGFAGLHQLLRPVLGELDGLPPRQRSALRAVLGLDDGAPDGMLVGSAVLTLVSNLAPLLIVVDDAQWIDRASLDVLSFVARRLDAEPVTLLLGVRSAAPLPGFGDERLELGPLSDEAANRLLDRQPAPPTGRSRVRILQEAAGNPLALIELARATPQEGVEGPLPVTERLERIYADQLQFLPEATRRSLLLLAAADATDVRTASKGLPEADDKAWTPAEQAGLVRQDGARIAFRHPLVRSAVYHAASFDERRQAHLALAELSEEPDRRAWHLAAATIRPDAEVSDALRQTAGRARRRGGYAAAAAALERAAELSPHPADRAGLLAEAAATAVFTGQLGWVERLAAEVAKHSDDPALIGDAWLATGRLMALRSNHAAAFAVLTRVADEHPSRAMDALAAAAVVRYYSGEESQRQRIERLLSASPDGAPPDGALPDGALPDGASPDDALPDDALPDSGLPDSGLPDSGLRVWVEAVSDPHGAGARFVPALPGLIAEAAGDAGRLTALAIVAWLLDETALAARTFDEAYDRWQAGGALPAGLGSAVGWAYLEQGRWAEARTVAAEIAATATTAGLDHAEACVHALDATVLALRGDADGARRGAGRALALVDPLESRSIAVAARRALGFAAVAEGDYETAYAQFRAAFTDEGEPVHYHVSPTVLAELAAAAVRRGRREDAAGLLDRAAGLNLSVRITAQLNRGRALLAEPDHAEPYFLAALADDAGEQWPFERAQTRLDYGEWLRRRRRIAEARPLLTAALETFRRLGARPWAERAEAELRAAGVEATLNAPGVLTELSPQQQQIVRLAARGLTNREIGDKLYLSPRTVGSHLYRVFPKLGITARSQLRDVLESA